MGIKTILWVSFVWITFFWKSNIVMMIEEIILEIIANNNTVYWLKYGNFKYYTSAIVNHLYQFHFEIEGVAILNIWAKIDYTHL